MKIKSRGRARGSLLIEVTVALVLLIGLAGVLMKYIFTIIQVDNWTIVQAMSESVLTSEIAYMERIPFETVLAAGSPFSLDPATSPAVPVTLGSLSAGNPITGTVRRMRKLTGNTTNPNFELQSWNLFTVLEYQVNGQNYYKVRSVVRTR